MKNRNLKEVIEEYTKIKEYSELLKFEYLAEKCGQIIAYIEKNQQNNTIFETVNEFYVAFSKLFENVYHDSKLYYENISTPNPSSSIIDSKSILKTSNITKTLMESPLDKNAKQTKGFFSGKATMTNKNHFVNQNQMVFHKLSDEIYKKFNKVKFEGIMKRKIDKTQINDEIQSILNVQKEVHEEKDTKQKKFEKWDE